MTSDPSDSASPSLSGDVISSRQSLRRSLWLRRLFRWLMAPVWRCAAFVVLILIGTTVAGLFARAHWLADLLANLRVQQVIAILIAMVITASLRHWRWLVIEVVLLTIHVPWFASAWRGRPSGSDPDFVVLVANVLTSNHQHRSIIRQIEAAEPDVFAIVELGSPLARVLEQTFAESYPHRSAISQDSGNFGVGVYSKYPLVDVEQFVLNVNGITSIAATIKKEGQSYRVLATHPLPPIGARGSELRNDHLSKLADRVSAFRQENPAIPMIVVGDLNLTPWSPLFGDFASASGLRRAGRGYGIQPTWYARPNFAFGLVLDHGLISEDLDCVSREVGEPMGSDHRAVRLGLKNR